ncbi:MAG TPA: DNA methyltransferase, partial [Ignavibacteria bacterium]
MENFDSTFAIVTGLVKDFKENEKRYLSPEYQEAEVRRDFIDKFFEALGWDVYHSKQKNPYEQEVKVEKGISIGKAQKRADYAFYIAPEFREPKFFTEAKKPCRNLKNADDYFQAVRYGWNANTPIAVLTDFEEFHILDCRIKPNINTVLQNQNHKSYHYTDYADIEKFKEIYFLFSRDAVANNSLEKYSDSLPKPKGISKDSFKKAYRAIDDDFLEYIDEVRETLAKAFKKNDTKLSSEELTEATQRTIDRLVFIRFLEDKLIEPEYYISGFGRKGDAWKDFISTCRMLDAKYNGIVFKKHFIDEQSFQGPEQNTFKKICDEMSYQNSPYDFNAIPIHILGSIYERFLGKVVNATAQRVKVEEKPEVRKAGGVYYTPKYIVDYIVDNTVGKILRNETESSPNNTSLSFPSVPSLSFPNAPIGNPEKTVGKTTPVILREAKNLGTPTPVILSEAKNPGKTPQEISKLRFADIACGSGSFLIGVFETLLKYHTEYYQAHPEQAKKDGCINKDGQWILSIKQKQKILVNNIYGVDIDQQATEVTQLSLALKMLEDESTATANEMQVLFHEKILPDLSKNI